MGRCREVILITSAILLCFCVFFGTIFCVEYLHSIDYVITSFLALPVLFAGQTGFLYWLYTANDRFHAYVDEVMAIKTHASVE
jgi:choline-glycine betaine transporter